MAKLSSAARKKMPKSEFGEPGKKAYPMPDKSHARNAKARASEMEHKGKISKSTEEKIDRKADKKLGEGGKGKTISPKSEHDHVSVRKIANGYMVRHSTNDPKRGYVESEHYSDKAPRIAVK